MRYLLILFLCVAGCADQTQKFLREASGQIAKVNASAAVIATNAEEIEGAIDRQEYDRVKPLAENIRKEVVNQKVALSEANKAIGKGSDSAAKTHDKVERWSDNLIGPGAMWWIKLTLAVVVGVLILVCVLSPANLFAIARFVFGWIKGLFQALFRKKGE